MYYIGYTSVISGGSDPRIYEYLKWNCGAEDGDTDAVDYDVNYFFTGSGQGGYVFRTPKEQMKRQLSAQYPSTETIRRSSIMIYFDQDKSHMINQMWVNVRCYNIAKAPWWVFILIAACGAFVVYLCVRKVQHMRRG